MNILLHKTLIATLIQLANITVEKIAKEMQVGDCVTFKRRNPDEMNDMKLLKMYLHKLYGKVYLKRAVRPWTQSSNFTQSRVWRVSADEKIENIRKWFAKQGLNSDEL